ncbi:MAG: type II secretion system F family protein [Patescibacteria group bacterium]
MTIFKYTALDKKDAFTKGVIEAKNEKTARAQLDKEGFMVVNLKAEKLKHSVFLNTIFQKIGRVDMIFFTRHLFTILESGIPLDQAIKITSDQTPNQKFREILEDIHKNLQRGQTFHYTLAQHPQFFSKFFVSLIKVGEKSGKMDEVLSYSLEQQENDYELVTKARSAMVYPAVILAALLVIFIFMITFVVPKITSVLTQYNVELPFLTKVIIGLSNFFIHYGLFCIPILAVLWYLFRKWKSTPKGKWHWDSFVLSLPRINLIVMEFNLARINRSLSALLKSGMQIDQALALTSEITNNSHYALSIKESIKFVQKGIAFSETLKGYPKLYPPITAQMVFVGEKTGKFDHMLTRLAVFYEKAVLTATGNLASVIEPVLLIVIGLAVAMMAIGILTPIWDYAQTI